MGGGGFSAEHGDPALDRYVLDVSEQPDPRICLLPTAGGDPEEQIQRFYRAFHDLPCTPTHLSLFRLGTKPVDLRALLLGQDVIYVGGGSLLNLLAIWRAHGLDGILREAWERGSCCAESARDRCAGSQQGSRRGTGPRARSRASVSCRRATRCTTRVEPNRRPCFHDAVLTEMAPPGYGVDDGAGLLFAGTDMIEAVSARAGSGAWWVDGDGDRASETALEVRMLPSEQPRPALEIAEYRRSRTGVPGRNRPATRAVGMGD